MWAPERAALEGIRRLEDFFKRIGLPTTLEGLGIVDDRLEEMASKATKSGTATLGSFVPLDQQDVLKILSLAKSMSSNGFVGTDALLESYFGGKPEFNQRLEGSGIHADVDLIARANGRSRVWRFVPEDGLNLATNKRLKDSFILEAAVLDGSFIASNIFFRF